MKRKEKSGGRKREIKRFSFIIIFYRLLLLLTHNISPAAMLLGAVFLFEFGKIITSPGARRLPAPSLFYIVNNSVAPFGEHSSRSPRCICSAIIKNGYLLCVRKRRRWLRAVTKRNWKLRNTPSRCCQNKKNDECIFKASINSFSVLTKCNNKKNYNIKFKFYINLQIFNY